MKVRFPTSIKKSSITLALLLCYGMSCFDMANIFADTTFDFNLFLNDFKEPGVFAWFLSAIQIAVFIGIISFTACVLCSDRFFKSVFFAIYIDSFFSLIHTIVFSYHENPYSLIIRNGFTAFALLFAYFILFNNGRTK